MRTRRLLGTCAALLCAAAARGAAQDSVIVIRPGQPGDTLGAAGPPAVAMPLHAIPQTGLAWVKPISSF